MAASFFIMLEFPPTPLLTNILPLFLEFKSTRYNGSNTNTIEGECI